MLPASGVFAVMRYIHLRSLPTYLLRLHIHIRYKQGLYTATAAG